MTWNISPSTNEVALLMEAGFIYRDAKKFQEAKDVFSGVRALSPQSDVPEVALGTVSFCEGDFDTAVDHYNKALEKNPRSAYAQAHLGEAYFFKMDKEKARRHLKKALELDSRGEFGKMARALLELVEEAQFK